MSSYQTIVLSGGGAKGPYGLGVLLALEKWHIEHAKKITKIYCGTSVGALNATLAAQGQLTELDALYARLQTKDILGTNKSSVNKFAMMWAAKRKPFHYFDNRALRATIGQSADFERLKDAHLLVCATNYTTGDLETFYSSELVDQFVAEDQALPRERQRLSNYHRINDQDELINALLASTAIPFYFPPVKIGDSLYVDGGVGNNTPLRQAAYISRFLNRRNEKTEPTFCVINDPSRFSIDSTHPNDIFGIIRRTLDLFHNELVSDAVISWRRINDEVSRLASRKSVLSSQISGLDEVTPERRASLLQNLEDAFDGQNAAAPRCELPIEVVRPSIQLLDDIMNFDPSIAKHLKRHGIADCLSLLLHRNYISHNDHRRWNENIQ
ncbi:hypothetical protein GTP81_08245 [Rugamonas sp. FT107W]|uniref:PNPLA domain-containing protein n=1 Tax=Duganella vulcania TaxID=2692166 RepID=A0A845HDA2_9BURK|nr:patatin-like phospholipase family protein [Duganella vulcania]MYN16741.1 hypothetical protein [Duganella vulcania]